MRARGRILKKSEDRIFAGVCGGLAEFLGWGSRQVRTLFVLFGAVGGGVIAYVVLWLLMPDPDTVAPGDFDLEDFRVQ